MAERSLYHSTTHSQQGLVEDDIDCFDCREGELKPESEVPLLVEGVWRSGSRVGLKDAARSDSAEKRGNRVEKAEDTLWGDVYNLKSKERRPLRRGCGEMGSSIGEK